MIVQAETFSKGIGLSHLISLHTCRSSVQSVEEITYGLVGISRPSGNISELFELLYSSEPPDPEWHKRCSTTIGGMHLNKIMVGMLLFLFNLTPAADLPREPSGS